MAHVVVVGGGIAGLATARFLAESGGDAIDVTLIEQSPRLGGKIVTDTVDGFVIEGGPDSCLTQKKEGVELYQAAGLGDELLPISSEHKSVFVLLGGRLRRVPAGFRLAVPTEFLPFVTTTLISPLGKLRMGMDLFIPARREDSDESVADFIRRRLGTEALERLAGPMMCGIYVADPERLSMNATFSMFSDMEQKYGSLTKAMLAARRRAPKPTAGSTPSPVFTSLQRGMQSLVVALEEQLTCERRIGSAVQAVGRVGDGLQVEVDGDRLDADAVVLATPAPAAAAMVAELSGELSQHLAAFRGVSSATISFGYRREDLPDAAMRSGLGYIVPRTEPGAIVACTWSSNKFGRRAPEGHALLRAFIGGDGREAALENDDDTVIAQARAELQQSMGITADPVVTRMYRWTKSNPQYDVGHLERVSACEELATAAHPALFLTGSSYRGIGVPDCIKQAKTTVAAVCRQLGIDTPASEAPATG
jgi:oxygen-dependent protoporphyrinogen oxidase